MRSLEDRFMEKVRQESKNGCWQWTAYLMPNGYAQIRQGGTSPKRYAHRVSWELFRGPIPEGLVIDHLCGNRGCVNPEHLEPVTIRTNVLRAPMGNSRKVFCPQGHPYDAHNTRLQSKRGGLIRVCRKCNKEVCRKWRLRRAELSAM